MSTPRPTRLTWPDGTPRSTGNAFDWRHTPSGLDWSRLRASADRTPKTPGGIARNNGTIPGGLSPRLSGLTINDGEFRNITGAAVHTATARAQASAAPAAAKASKPAKAPKLHPVTAQRHHTGAYSKV